MILKMKLVKKTPYSIRHGKNKIICTNIYYKMVFMEHSIVNFHSFYVIRFRT